MKFVRNKKCSLLFVSTLIIKLMSYHDTLMQLIAVYFNMEIKFVAHDFQMNSSITVHRCVHLSHTITK